MHCFCDTYLFNVEFINNVPKKKIKIAKTKDAMILCTMEISLKLNVKRDLKKGADLKE